MSPPARQLDFTSRQVEKVLGIKPSTLRKWVERGYVRKVGWNRYVIADIIKRCQQEAAERSDTCA